MIKLTRLGGKELIINANLIELIEATPDSVLTLTTGRKLLVQESPDEIISRAATFFQNTGGPRLVISAEQDIKE